MICECCGGKDAVYEIKVVINEEDAWTLTLCYACCVFFKHRTCVLRGLFSKYLNRKE